MAAPAHRGAAKPRPRDHDACAEKTFPVSFHFAHAPKGNLRLKADVTSREGGHKMVVMETALWRRHEDRKLI